MYNGLHNVSLIKGTNRLPSDRFILKNTIKRYKQFICVWQYNIFNDYYITHGYPVEIPYDQLEKKIESYYQWLAGQLSIFGEVARTDVYDKLKSLESSLSSVSESAGCSVPKDKEKMINKDKYDKLIYWIGFLIAFVLGAFIVFVVLTLRG